MEAAVRELYEETGLTKDDVVFGPVVWFGDFEMVLSGTLMHLHQQFIVAHTRSKSTTMDHLTDAEKKVIKETRWFSLDDIRNCEDVIYPVGLVDHLPNILNGKYPINPVWIDLGKKPEKKR